MCEMEKEVAGGEGLVSFGVYVVGLQRMLITGTGGSSVQAVVY